MPHVVLVTGVLLEGHVLVVEGLNKDDLSAELRNPDPGSNNTGFWIRPERLNKELKMSLNFYFLSQTFS